MKKSVKNVSLILLLGVVALCICLCMLSFKMNRTAVAEDATSRITFELDSDDKSTKEILPGGEFKLTVRISTTHEDTVWSALSFYIMPLNSDGKLDADVVKYLSCDYDMFNTFWDSRDNEFGDYGDSSGVFFDKANPNNGYYGLLVSFSRPDKDSQMVSSNTPFVLEYQLKVLDTIPKEIESFRIGITDSASNKVAYGYSTDITDYANDGKLEANSVTIKIRQPGENATLEELKVGHEGSDIKTFSAAEGAENALLTAAEDTDGSMFCVSNSKTLDNFTVLPTATDEYAGIELSLKSFDSDDISETDIQKVESGKNVTLTLQAGENTVYIRVTSEDGKSTEIYAVKVKMAYVRLGALTATSTTPTTGVTKNGLKDTFDPDTEETIVVYVPSDYDTDTGVEVSASVLEGYGASTDISVSTKNCDADKSTLISGEKIIINNFNPDLAESEEPPYYTLTLKLTASDGTEREYAVSFEIVSVDTGITLKVTGVDSGSELANNEALAAAENVDYYYFVTTEASGKAKFDIAAQSGAAITVNAAEYDNNTEYGEETHTIVITAEAGNTKTYTVILAKQMFLKLAEGSAYQFLTELEYEEGGDTRHKRTAYAEMKDESGKVWEHGISDSDLERVVLGQVSEATTVNKFLENIDSTQLNLLWLYNTSGKLIYKFGAPADGISASDLDDFEAYPIATGWCVKYGADEETADTVYVSVLGDVDGSGTVDAVDVSIVVSYIKGTRTFNLEERLAAYFINDGEISALDCSKMVVYIKGSISINDFFYYPSITD